MNKPPIYKDEASDFYEQFGRFINAYSHVEDKIHVLFRHVAGVSIETGRVIASGMRLSDITERIKKLCHIKDVPTDERKRIDDILQHFDLITKLRHNLVHRSGHASKDRYTTINLITSKSLHDYEICKLE